MNVVDEIKKKQRVEKTGFNFLFMFINKSLTKKGMWKVWTEDSDKEHDWYSQLSPKWAPSKLVKVSANGAVHLQVRIIPGMCT